MAVKESCKILNLGRTSPLQWCRLELDGQGSSSVGNVWEVAGSKLNVSPWCALASDEGEQYGGLAGLRNRCTASRWRKVTIPFFSAFIRSYLKYHIQLWKYHVQYTFVILEVSHPLQSLDSSYSAAHR